MSPIVHNRSMADANARIVEMPPRRSAKGAHLHARATGDERAVAARRSDLAPHANGIVLAARTARVLWQRNGMRWLTVFGLWAAQSRLLRFLSDRLRKMERERELPGFFEPSIAAQIWQDYDWERGGEEWSVSAEWRESLVENVIDAWLPLRAAVLEIGPGAGRWTGHLHDRAERLVLVDVAPRCLALCQSQLNDTQKTEYCLGNGWDLSPLEDESIDFAWSFDVFVHLTGAVTASYLRELRRVLRTGGRALIHHSACVPANGRWRSEVTAPDFIRLACQADLSVVDQFDSWGNEREFDVRFHNAVITVLEKR